MKWLVLALLLVASPALAETPRFTVGCDLDGWTCDDGFPALSKDSLTIVHAIGRDNKIFAEFISVATGKVLRRELVFQGDHKTADRVARLARELARFRSMSLESQDTENDLWVYKLGTLTLTIAYCESESCKTTYRVQRRRR